MLLFFLFFYFILIFFVIIFFNFFCYYFFFIFFVIIFFYFLEKKAFSIYTGLSSSAIQRLKAWKIIREEENEGEEEEKKKKYNEKYEKICELFKTSFNMKNLREFQDSLYENKSGVFPSMTVLLKDLFQISDTKKNTNYLGLYNIEKTIFNGKLITKFFLSVDLADNYISSLNLTLDQEVIDYLIKCEVWDTERINVVSELRQPKIEKKNSINIRPIKSTSGDVQMETTENENNQNQSDINQIMNNRNKTDHKLSSLDWKLICMGGKESKKKKTFFNIFIIFFIIILLFYFFIIIFLFSYYFIIFIIYFIIFLFFLFFLSCFQGK